MPDVTFNFLPETHTNFHVGVQFMFARGLGSCVDPEVVSVAALDASGTLWRVTFAEPMLDSAPLSWVGSYEIFEADPGGDPVPGGHEPDVLDVTPEAVAQPTYVDLTTEEHDLSLEYRLRIVRVEVA